MIINNTLTEIGDVLIIYSQVVVSASLNITSFTEDIEGETGMRTLTRQFRFSLDGVNYSEWKDLTNDNLESVDGFVSGLAFFEFRYERSGTDASGIIEFNGIQLVGEIELQICNNTATMSSIFADLANNDFYTLSVRNNILKKIYQHGILPKFIERGPGIEDKDFVDFWGAVCMFMAYFSAFAENFDNILYKKEYLAEYLKQHTLQLNPRDIIYQHLFYLACNFHDEIRKRGTKMTLYKVNSELADGSITPVDGEWLRLICRNHYDEFLVEVIQKEHSGFCLGKSSPMYNGTYFSNQINKTEENTSDFNDLSKYTLIGSPTIVINGGKKCLLINDNEGLGYDISNPPEAVDPNELIIIDENIDYEITFDFLRTSGGGNLVVGILGFNRNGVLLTNYITNIFNNIPNNRLLNSPIPGISKVVNNWYSFRGILYSKDSVQLSATQGQTNLNKGSNLKIKRNNIQPIEKIKICLYATGASGLNLYIHNLKMRPLVRGKSVLRTYKEGSNTETNAPHIINPQFLQSNTFCMNWRKNNNQDKDDKQVDNFIQNYLLPYQQRLVSVPLTPYTDDIQIL